MRINKLNEVVDYESPEMEVISTVVERGFEASYGDYGEAGDEYDIFGNGDF